jgi:xanthine dehydrogenase molybdenum-binding subunit
MTLSIVGKSALRKDLREKVTGQARFSADLKLPDMLYGRILRSPHPHANVLKVDTSQAIQLPGVFAVVTPFDVPQGRIAPDIGILDTRVRFVGDEVAAVAATDDDTAIRALALIRVEYQILPFVLDPEQALLPDAVAIHDGGNLATGQPLSLERGDVALGFDEADLVLEEEYRIPTHSASPMEPRAALASWENDSLTIWKSTRGVHVDRQTIAKALEIPPERVRVVGPFLGGGFGNKDDSRLGAITAVLAQRAGKPVRIEYSREEEFVAGRVRHAAKVKTRVGIKNDGTITAIHTVATLDTGAYLASGPGVARRTGQASLYLYYCPNAKYEAWVAYTNRPVAGSYRALGAPQGHFALETLMDRAAEAVGMDPLQFRLKNRVRPEGQPGSRISPPDQIIDSQPVEGGIPFSSNGLEECLLLGAEAFGWNNSVSASESRTGGHDPIPTTGDSTIDLSQESAAYSPVKIGRGMSIMIYRGGPGFTSSAEIEVDNKGRVTLSIGVIDVGEGATTVLAQIAAEVLGTSAEDVNVRSADTLDTPDAPITAGSTATFSTGSAVVEAANQVKRQLLALASTGMEAPINELDCANGKVVVKDDPRRSMRLTEVAKLMEVDCVSAASTIQPGSSDYIVNSFGAHFVEVAVDTDTGAVRVNRYVAAQDSGRIINPKMALNQVEGAISQMLGFALWEELVTDPSTGVTLNASYLQHRVPTIEDYPEIQVIFADIVDPVGPLGAKGLGEVPCPGVAPAIANAIYDAVGIRLNRLPMNPANVLRALAARSLDSTGLGTR